MAGMDLKLRRNDRGVSVFWMILISGAAVFVLLAIVLVVSSADSIDEQEMALDSEAPTVTAGDSDPMPGSASFDDGQAADEAPVAPEDIEPPEVDIIDPEVEAAPASEDETLIEDSDGLDEALTEGDEGDIVVDPQGEGVVDPVQGADYEHENIQGIAPFTETPSGPEGRDDEVILEDEATEEGIPEMDGGVLDTEQGEITIRE